MTESFSSGKVSFGNVMERYCGDSSTRKSSTWVGSISLSSITLWCWGQTGVSTGISANASVMLTGIGS